MNFSNKSLFHSNEISNLNDRIARFNFAFTEGVLISIWSENLEKMSQQLFLPYTIVALIKAKKGTKISASESTLLTFNTLDADYISSYQRLWIRNEHIEEFYGIYFGPKSLLEEKPYSKNEIETAIEHILSLLLVNQPEAQLKYFNLFRSNYTVNPPLALEQLNDLHYLWNIIRLSLEVAVDDLIDIILLGLATLIRKLKIENVNVWRYKQQNGELNPDYDPIIPILYIHEFGTVMLQRVKYISDEVLEYIGNKKNNNDNQNLVSQGITNAINVVFAGVSKLADFLIAILDVFVEFAAHINAFLVGFYNGVIEFVASLFDHLAFFAGMVKQENRDALMDTVDEYYEKYQKDGIWSIIEEIILTFLQKYKDASDSYDIMKLLAEDITQIALELLIIAVTEGAAGFKKLSKILEDLKKGVFKAKFIGATKIIDDVLKRRVKLDEYIDEFGKIRKRKKNDHTRRANFTEMVGNETILALKTYRGKPARFKLLDVVKVPTSLDDKIRKGIDAIYENELFKQPPPPPKYLINEVKGNVAGTKSFNPLNKLGVTKYGGKQMNKVWIEINLEKLGRELYEEIDLYGYDPVLTGVEMDGSIHSMTLLDESAKKIENLK